jgi:hypothetical protein
MKYILMCSFLLHNLLAHFVLQFVFTYAKQILLADTVARYTDLLADTVARYTDLLADTVARYTDFVQS